MPLLLTLCFFLVGLNWKIETDYDVKNRIKEKRWLREKDKTLRSQDFYREDETLREERYYQADGKTLKIKSFHHKDEIIKEAIIFRSNGKNYYLKVFLNKKEEEIEKQVEKITLYDKYQIIFYETTDQKIGELIMNYFEIDFENDYSSFVYLKNIIENYQNDDQQLMLILTEFNQAVENNALEVFLEKFPLALTEKTYGEYPNEKPTIIINCFNSWKIMFECFFRFSFLPCC